MNYFDPLLLLGIFVLAGLGSMLRYLMSKWEGAMPWGILTANILASFIAGVASSSFQADLGLTAFIVVGFAGGLSTFSSWAGASVQLAAKEKAVIAGLYTLFTLILSSTATYLGLLVR